MIRRYISFDTFAARASYRRSKTGGRNAGLRNLSDHMKKDIGWYHGLDNATGAKHEVVARDIIFRFDR